MFRWSLLKTEHCVWLGVASIFLSLVFGKTLQMTKKLVKMIGCRHVWYHICRRNCSFSLRQNISNLCQSIFVFLTVYYDKIFKHWLESSSIRLRVSFFIAFVHRHSLKCWRTKSKSKSSRLIGSFFSEVKRFRALKWAFSLKFWSV